MKLIKIKHTDGEIYYFNPVNLIKIHEKFGHVDWIQIRVAHAAQREVWEIIENSFEIVDINTLR